MGNLKFYVRLFCILACVGAVAGMFWGYSQHNNYLLARMLALFVTTSSVAANPDLVTKRVKQYPKITIVVLSFILLIFIILLFAERFIRIIAYLMGNPHALTPF